VASTSFGTDDPATVQRIFIPFLRPFMKSSTQGAVTSIHLASAPELEQVSADLVGLTTPTDAAVRPLHSPKI